MLLVKRASCNQTKARSTLESASKGAGSLLTDSTQLRAGTQLEALARHLDYFVFNFLLVFICYYILII